MEQTNKKNNTVEGHTIIVIAVTKYNQTQPQSAEALKKEEYVKSRFFN